MFGNLEFFGSATVGERGQVVLPIELRKKINLQPSEKLIVMGTMNDNFILLIKADFLTEILGRLEQGETKLRELLRDSANSESNDDNEGDFI
ncbi:MAG: AbrB/MazE/SpoVT family DNA-binding domain-containing protein [Promethearchaeota archaeon]